MSTDNTRSDVPASTIPSRDKVLTGDTWDLSSLFDDDAAWEEAFAEWEKLPPLYKQFRGRTTESPAVLLECIEFHLELQRSGERLGVYAFLKTAEDFTNSNYQAMQARFMRIASRAGEAFSYFQPELLAADDETMNGLIESQELEPYKLLLERMLREKPHTLSEPEERLLAMQTEMAQATRRIFDQLNDADMKFPSVEDENGELHELTQGTFTALLRSSDRTLRRNTFKGYYSAYDQMRNTYATTLGGSMQKDVYYARARKFDSARESVLFHEFIPASVYDNLVETVRGYLPVVHRYYDVRRRKMELDEIHFYDTYVPILTEFQTNKTWDQAVTEIVEAVAPLGPEYGQVLEKGLRGRWCDRYENQGKDSGAFSYGTYDGDPYILMNYKGHVLDHAFTLAHEAGHSMHSHYSSKNQPYQYYDYELFVAEVASTFNEQLLSRYMFDRAETDRERANLVNREIDAVRGTIIRQTMFAEFEKITHEMLEEGEPLTVDSYLATYHSLLEAYFGPNFVLDPELDLECFRIPHFYRSFYVYKYATGMSAAVALADRVLAGGEEELNDYLGFLSGGCSKTPLELLRDAGVDMEQPTAVEATMKRFELLVDELDELI
jgi:oligoendopeptidase F